MGQANCPVHGEEQGNHSQIDISAGDVIHRDLADIKNNPYPVVVADFLVLIPGRGLAALGAPFANLIGVLLGIRNEQSAGGACDDRVAVEPPVTREENPNILWLINRQSTTSSIISSLLTTFFSDQGRRTVTEQKNDTKKQHTLFSVYCLPVTLFSTTFLYSGSM